MLNANRNCFHGFQIQNFQIEIYCDNFSKDDYQGILPRNNNHGNWPSQKINWHINILELSILIAVKLALIIFYKGKESKFNSFSNRQHNSSKISKYLLAVNEKIKQRNLGILFILGGQSYCRIPIQFNKCSDRPRIPKMEIKLFSSLPR